MFRSDSCVYSDAYIVLNGTINLLAAAANETAKAEKNVQKKFSIKIMHFKDKTEILDIVMSMYDLLEYSYNYSMT